MISQSGRNGPTCILHGYLTLQEQGKTGSTGAAETGTAKAGATRTGAAETGARETGTTET